MKDFYARVASGDLPNFTWINPRAGVDKATGEGSNDMHPDHDMRLGERLYKDIYEALRAGPAWNDTLFVLTFDEHGGFASHVPPPTNVPAPDNSTSYPEQFDFKRLGVRIPTLLISPWIDKGTVVSAPPAAQKPEANSEYDLTSIPATVKKLFGLPSFLTARDAWAATFEHVLETRSEPRTDCPATLPPAPSTLDSEGVAYEAAQPLNDLQEEMLAILSQLNNVPHPHFQAQGDVSPWLREQTAVFLGGANEQN